MADSSFPSGGFAHSGGLEAAWQAGEIRSSAELTDFIHVHLSQTGRGALPFLNETYREPLRLGELDQIFDAFLSNQVANRASRAQGQAWLLAIERTFGTAPLVELRQTVLGLAGHFAPVFGAATSLLQISHSSAIRLFVFMALRSLVSSAVRLGIVGPLEAQNLQSRLALEAERVCEHCAHLGAADAAHTAPLLDILQGAHDRLYSRLFQS